MVGRSGTWPPHHPGPDPLIDADIDWDQVTLVNPDVPREVGLLDANRSTITGARFTGARVERVRAVDTLFIDCEFSGAELEEGTITRVRFERCRMSGAVVAGLKATHAVFADCRIDDANFRATSLTDCTFDQCDLRAADFYGASLVRSRFAGCDLSGTEFSKATLDSVSLRGSKLEGLRGADRLRGAIIGSDQLVPVALALFAALGITVDDDEEAAGR